jgi:hypothetical protein
MAIFLVKHINHYIIEADNKEQAMDYSKDMRKSNKSGMYWYTKDVVRKANEKEISILKMKT